MGLLLAEIELSDLGVGQNADDRAVLLDSIQFLVNGSSLLVLLVVESIFGEGLSLGLVPVLVETAADLLAQMLGPDSGQTAESLGSFDVSNNSNNNHWRSFDNRHCFANFLLVQFRSRFVDFTNNVSHTSLVAHEGSQMAWIL